MFEKGVCVLSGEGVHGVVYFTQDFNKCKITGNIHVKNSSNQKHGFHIHEYGDLSEHCVSAGPHYNPFNSSHGSIDSLTRHVGDLGNVHSDYNGHIALNLECEGLNLSGPFSIIGRALVLHQKEDDLGQKFDEESRKTGNSGPRIACGVIGLARSN